MPNRTRSLSDSSLSIDNLAALDFDGLSGIASSGHNDSVGTTFETIWTEGGVYVYLANAEVLDIVSTDAKDTSDGVGARTLKIDGLDDNFLEVTETISLNGTTPVTTSQAFLRVNKVIVIAVGSEGDTAGNIVATGDTSTSVKVFAIEAGTNQSEACLFTVPANKKFLPTFLQLGNGKTDTSTLRFKIRQDPKTATSAFITTATLLQSEGLIFSFLPGSVTAPAKSDIQFDGKASTGTDDLFTTIAGVFLPA